MDKLLIVTSSDQGRKFLTELCAAQSLGRPSVAENGAQARRMLIDDCYDLIVINAPLRDEFGQELPLGLTQSTDAGIILLVKGEMRTLSPPRWRVTGGWCWPNPSSTSALPSRRSTATLKSRRWTCARSAARWRNRS